MKSSRPLWLFYAALILLALGLIEAALQGLSLVSRRVSWLLNPSGEIAVADSQLEWRPNPAFPEHDSRGFRNRRAPQRASLVALGDSQTYGVGVGAGEAWPARLEAQAGREVYSMAFSGYGPGHSVLLWPEALTLRPETIVEGFYSGNDLYDAYHLVHDRGQLPRLATTDGAELGRMRAADQAERLEAKINRLSPTGGGSRAPQRGIRRWVAQHCKTYGLLRMLKRAVLERATPAPDSEDSDEAEWQRTLTTARQVQPPPGWEIFEQGRFRTVFRPDYRLTALDRGDPRIAEGWRISLNSLLELDRLAKTNGVRFFVLLIPTKELVFAPYWTNATPSFRRLIDYEQALWTDTRAFLRSNRIEYVEALPGLRAQLAAGVQPYPVTDDGHPNRFGHEAIAAGVAKRWQAPPAGPEQP